MRPTRTAVAVLAFAALSSARADVYCNATVGAIPDGTGAGVTRTFTVPAPAAPQVVTGVEVDLVVSHPWVGDLRAVLTAPWGTQVVLLDRPGIPSSGWPGPWGCGFDDVNCRFTDAGSAPAESACAAGSAALSGWLKPLQPLAVLAAVPGHAPQGTWTLVVSDASTIDAGSIQSACLRLTTAPDCNLNGRADAVDIAQGGSEDANGDGVPDECQCVADLNGSGTVDGADLAVVLAQWGAGGQSIADLNHDGTVNGADLGVLVASWGPCGGAAQ